MWSRRPALCKEIVAAVAAAGMLIATGASAAEQPQAAASQGAQPEKLRITVPEGVRIPAYVETTVGSYTLAWARAVGMRALYQNETSLAPSEREAMRSTITQFFATRFDPSAKGVSDPLANQRLEYSDRKPSPQWYANLANWRTWPDYTDRERLIIEFTRRFAFDSKQLNADDAFWDRMHKHYSDREIVDMSNMVAKWTAAFLSAEVLGLRVVRASTPPAPAGPNSVGAITKTMLDAVESRADRTVRMQHVK